MMAALYQLEADQLGEVKVEQQGVGLRRSQGVAISCGHSSARQPNAKAYGPIGSTMHP